MWVPSSGTLPRRRHNNSIEDGWLCMDGPFFSQELRTDGRGRRCSTPPLTGSLTLPVWHSRTGRAGIVMRRRRRKGKRQKGSKLRVSRQYARPVRWQKSRTQEEHSMSTVNVAVRPMISFRNFIFVRVTHSHRKSFTFANFLCKPERDGVGNGTKFAVILRRLC